MITNIAHRIIDLSSSYSTDKEFLEDCGITNRSLLTELRKGRLQAPGADILEQIVRGTGCNGTWLLTGEGPMFGSPQENPQAAEPGRDYDDAEGDVRQALRLIGMIEQLAAETKDAELLDDLSYQALQLATKLQERRRKAGTGEDE